MLVLPDGRKLHIKADVEMSRDAMQVLIDAEAFFVNMGLGFQLRCIDCMRSGDTDNAYCTGDVSDDHKAFTVECGCSKRVGRGDFTVPPTPDVPTVREPLPDGSKRRENITHAQVAHIMAFEAVVFKSLKLQYLLRCLRCEMAGEMSNGVCGVKDKTEFVMECACTKRVAPNSRVSIN